MDVATQKNKENGSYRNILKSTSLVGGASVLTMLISMVRTKFVAILIGPSGVGLIGMYLQITALIATMTGLGLNSSGVRQIAESVGSNDDARVARTVTTVRRMSWLAGGLGMSVMIVFCVPISHISFSSNAYAWPIAVLGVTVLTGSIATGQGCVINGTRRIGDLAKISIIGSINGTLISVPCFYFWRQEGIVPSLILTAFAVLATSWWFARRVPVKLVSFAWRDSYGEAHQLLKLGISLMGAVLLNNLSYYLIRVIMMRQFGLTDVGIYQAAFSLSGILVGFVLGAMGADYYPRLTAIANNNENVRLMVNEQSQISILLALPGLAAMTIFSPMIINMFYATSFSSAVPILRWCILGMLGRVFSWPMGFVMLAKGKGKLFFVTEAFICGLHVFLVLLFTRVWGLDGAGIAFMTIYIIYTAMMIYVMHKLVGATWTHSTLKLILLSTAVMVMLMLNCTLIDYPIITLTVNVVILTVVSAACFKLLGRKSGIGLNTILSKCGLKK